MKKFSLFLLSACTALLSGADVFDIKVESTSRTGLAAPGEKVTVKLTPTLNGKPIPAGYTLTGKIWQDGGIEKKVNVPAEKGFTTVLSSDKPGWAFVRTSLLNAKNPKKKIVLSGRNYRGSGILVVPEKLVPARPEPADFDKFWDSCKAELAKVPLKVLEKKQIPVRKGAEKYAVTYDMKISCAGKRPVSGYLSVPLDKSRKYPVILGVDGAGVFTSWQLPAPNAIRFNINAHGILNGQPKKYYADLSKGELRGYMRIGSAKRETMYFKYMFLRVLRALEFLKTMPEWNGKDIIVTGSSQGGAQTLFAAAMDKDVTLASATVPAMVDFAGTLAANKRLSGWPQPYTALKKDAAKPAVWDYFDMMNFGRRIKCPIYISVGLIDGTCPPNGIYAMYNLIPSKDKHIELHRDMGHYGRNLKGGAAISRAVQAAAKK